MEEERNGSETQRCQRDFEQAIAPWVVTEALPPQGGGQGFPGAAALI